MTDTTAIRPAYISERAYGLYITNGATWDLTKTPGGYNITAVVIYNDKTSADSITVTQDGYSATIPRGAVEYLCGAGGVVIKGAGGAGAYSNV